MNISTELLKNSSEQKPLSKNVPVQLFCLLFWWNQKEGGRETCLVLAGLARTAIRRLQHWVSAQLDSKMNQKSHFKCKWSSTADFYQLQQVKGKIHQRPEQFSTFVLWLEAEQGMRACAMCAHICVCKGGHSRSMRMTARTWPSRLGRQTQGRNPVLHTGRGGRGIC